MGGGLGLFGWVRGSQVPLDSSCGSDSCKSSELEESRHVGRRDRATPGSDLSSEKENSGYSKVERYLVHPLPG